MSENDFLMMSKNCGVDGERAYVRLLGKGDRTIYTSYSDSEGCWDYTIFDEKGSLEDGGQFETDGDGHEIETAYDAVSTLACDEFGIYDISDGDEVEFLDPEDGLDMMQKADLDW